MCATTLFSPKRSYYGWNKYNYGGTSLYRAMDSRFNRQKIVVSPLKMPFCAVFVHVCKIHHWLYIYRSASAHA